MGVTMKTTKGGVLVYCWVIDGNKYDKHLMSSIPNLLQLARERFHRVAWNEPCSFNSVLVKQLQNTVDPNSGTKNTPRNIRRTSRLTRTSIDPF